MSLVKFSYLIISHFLFTFRQVEALKNDSGMASCEDVESIIDKSVSRALYQSSIILDQGRISHRRATVRQELKKKM